MEANHNHQHTPNRFAAIPTEVRLNALSEYTGRGVTIAFLDSGFYPHPDLLNPANRVIAYTDITQEQTSFLSDRAAAWQWHGTQTSVVAAGNGYLSDGVYRGLAHESELVLVKVSEAGRITEENITRGLEWILANRERYNIRVMNISLGGDEDIPCSKSIIDQAAEEAVRNGIVVVAAAGNSGAEGRHSIPPANSPSVITVGGYTDNNEIKINRLGLYHSNFGVTADGTVKPEIVAPAMWVAAPILPGTATYDRAEALSSLAAAPDYQLPNLVSKLLQTANIPAQFLNGDINQLRFYIDELIKEQKIIATHYQHVDGTSFAAPIVSSIVAQMVLANPQLTPCAVKNILISTADRISTEPVIRQGYGVVNARRAVELARSEPHVLNFFTCEPPRIENGHLSFVFHDDHANTVSVAGDFNDWNHGATPLSKNTFGFWSTQIAVSQTGQIEYKFIIDGQRWVEDPNNGLKTPDNHGGLNSVVVIE